MQLNSSALNVEELNGGTSLVTLELGTAALTFVANTQQLNRANQLQPGSLDFSREVFQIATVNNIAVSVFDFVQPDISIVGNLVTLSTAGMDFVADTLQLAITNNIVEGSLNLIGESIGQAVGPILAVAAMDFVGIDLAPVQIVTLNPATFVFTAQTATPAAVITLLEEPMDFVVLGVIPANAPLGTVEGLVTKSFDFAVNAVQVLSSITLDVTTLGFTATEINSTTVNNLAASDLILTPQDITVTQAAVQVLLEVATFNFIQGSLQLTGISSAGDRKRMLFGVGR